MINRLNQALLIISCVLGMFSLIRASLDMDSGALIDAAQWFSIAGLQADYLKRF